MQLTKPKKSLRFYTASTRNRLLLVTPKVSQENYFFKYLQHTIYVIVIALLPHNVNTNIIINGRENIYCAFLFILKPIFIYLRIIKSRFYHYLHIARLRFNMISLVMRGKLVGCPHGNRVGVILKSSFRVSEEKFTMIQMVCPHCSQDLQIPDEYLGARGRCKKCGGNITVEIRKSLVPEGPFMAIPPVYTYDAQKSEALILAAGRGDRNEVERLLRDGAYVNAKDRLGMMAIHAASRIGNVEIVRLLLVYGADVNARAGDGCTPLHLAAAGAHKDLARFLVGQSFNVDAADHDQQTPLHLIARSREPVAVVKEIIEYLLARSANINAPAKDGSTPLHEACEHGHPEIQDYLRARNAT
jgi:hypothetical protein